MVGPVASAFADVLAALSVVAVGCQRPGAVVGDMESSGCNESH